MQAFLADPALKVALIQRLATRHLLKRLVPREIHWDGDRGSVVGCLLESTDLDAWEQSLGLPKWLALAIDGLAAMQPSADASADAGLRLIDAIAPGSDLSAAGGRLIRHLLADADDGLAGLAMPDVAVVVEHIVDLHARRDEPGAAPVSRDDWRKVRRAATALTDRLEPGLQRSIAACAEGAAWDPETSRSAVLDTLRGWSSARVEEARQGYPWKSADDAHMQARLDGLHAEAALTSEPGTFNVFELLEARYPDEADRLKAFNAFERTQLAEVGPRMLELVLRWLARAGSPHEESSAEPGTPGREDSGRPKTGS